ncbi:hypothetical protein [Halalkalibaculum sp. DA384]|uniref:hypothetical protein n=1 Tax=Halalkalibaculum sp. DA384 TaxID=3373606 RepID=UPI0037546A81
MKTYKIIFDSGVTERVEVGSIEYNDHIGRIEINDENGDEMEQFYLDFEQIAAIIPQD